jgi:hypothetical protein
MIVVTEEWRHIAVGLIAVDRDMWLFEPAPAESINLKTLHGFCQLGCSIAFGLQLFDMSLFALDRRSQPTTNVDSFLCQLLCSGSGSGFTFQSVRLVLFSTAESVASGCSSSFGTIGSCSTWLNWSGIPIFGWTLQVLPAGLGRDSLSSRVLSGSYLPQVTPRLWFAWSFLLVSEGLQSLSCLINSSTSFEVEAVGIPGE